VPFVTIRYDLKFRARGDDLNVRRISKMAALLSLDLRLSDPVTELWRKVAEGMQGEELKAACGNIGVEMRDGWGCINIACMANPRYSREDVVELIGRHRGNTPWIRTVELLIGHTYLPAMRMQAGVPASAITYQPSGSTRFTSTEADRYAGCTFPTAKIRSAVKETSDLKEDTLTYNDTKAVMKEFWLWQATQRCTIANDVASANSYAMMLYDMDLRPWGKSNWSQKIFNRKRNGRRSNAQVSPPPPPHMYGHTHHPTTYFVLCAPQDVYKDVKVNAGDLCDAARDLVAQGLFLQVDEEANEKTYEPEDIFSPDEWMEAASGAADELMEDGDEQDCADEQIAAAQESAQVLLRHRSATEKAAELCELRKSAQDASAAAAAEKATVDKAAVEGSEQPPEPAFAGSKAQPLTAVVDPACGGRKRPGKKPLADVTNTKQQAPKQQAPKKQAAKKPAAKKPAAKKPRPTPTPATNDQSSGEEDGDESSDADNDGERTDGVWVGGWMSGLVGGWVGGLGQLSPLTTCLQISWTIQTTTTKFSWSSAFRSITAPRRIGASFMYSGKATRTSPRGSQR
jgi:hypothetical protein